MAHKGTGGRQYGMGGCRAWWGSDKAALGGVAAGDGAGVNAVALFPRPL